MPIPWRVVEGYENSSYGDAFADVYDDWYADISDVEATVSSLAQLQETTSGEPVLELGVGTGRLAIPLAARVHPTAVFGLDSSQAMLDRLAANQQRTDAQHLHPVHPVLGDMVDGLPDGAFGLVFVAFNTFFNIGTADRQQACLDAVRSRLAPNGRLVVEAYVPDDVIRTGSHVEVRTITADRVVLSVARYDGASQQAEGQFVEFTQAGGVRLRPWSIRHVAPDELDAMAARAGLRLVDRWETFAREPFDGDSARHVSIYAAM